MKRKWLWFILLGFLITSIQACTHKFEAEESCNFIQNASNQRVSWGYLVPVKIHIHESVPLEFHEPIRVAMEEWNKLAGKDLLTIELTNVGGAIPTGRDGFSTIYLLDEWDDEKSNEQARTSVYWKGQQIIEADIRINAKDFTYTTESEPELGRVDVMSLMLHEFGHVLGLSHLDEDGSVMLTQLSKGESRRDLSYGGPDFHSLKCEY